MSTITVVVLGAPGVGKSTMVRYFTRGVQPERRLSGRVYKLMHPVGNGTTRSLKVVDLHSSFFSTVSRARIRYRMETADVFAVVYDVGDRSSYRTAIDICLQIYNTRGRMDVPLILVGNKADLRCQISEYQLGQLGDLPRVITISRNGGNVNFMFDHLLRLAMEDERRNGRQFEAGKTKTSYAKSNSA